MFDEFPGGDGFNGILDGIFPVFWNIHIDWWSSKLVVKHPFVEIFRITDPQKLKKKTVRETGQKGWDDWKSYCKNWVLVSFLDETVFSTRLVVQLSRLTATSLQDVQHLELRNVTVFAILQFILGYCVSERKTPDISDRKQHNSFYLANTQFIHQPIKNTCTLRMWTNPTSNFDVVPSPTKKHP